MDNYFNIDNPQEVNRLFEIFFNYVRALIEIPKSDQENCRHLFSPVFVKKDTILEAAGTLHKYHNFIVSGHIRNFHHNKEGKEITTDINDGPRFFTSYYHFIHQTISNENLQCITDCEILRISRENLGKAASIGLTSPEYTARVLQYYLELSKQRIIDLTTLTGKERYLKLLNNHPSILKNVPLTHIASYLGLNAGSLSRIRQKKF